MQKKLPALRIAIIYVVFLFQLPSFSQNTSNFGRTYSDTLPNNFKLDVSKLRDHIYAGIPSSIRNGEYPRRAIHFAHENAYGISELISGGQIYSDWMPLENYLNEILKKVIPKELKNDSIIHIYIVRDGDYNAFMTPSGHAFVNIGLLAEVTNEAEIAGILSHELAHYYLKHSLYTFLEKEAGTFDQGIFFTNKAASRYSIKDELQADSLAIVWLRDSGYNINGLISSFETMHRLDRNQIKRLKDKWELKETTHPSSEKRLQQLNEFYTRYKNDPGKYFLVDENKFNQFKEEVKPEILKQLLNDFEYYTCIEKAFRFHIFDPDNSVYIYYLLESIRRNCYLDASLWNKMFITNRYYDSVTVDNIPHKELMTDHLFKKFDLDIIPIAPKEGVKIKARFYWRDQPKFTTYEEAFVFFYNVSQALNCHECILSNALSFTKNHESRDKLLEEYLKHPDIQHKVFAENLLAGTTTKNLKDQKLLVFNRFETTIRHGYEVIPLGVKSSEKNPLSAIFDSVMITQKNRAPIFMSTFKNNHLNDYNMLMELEHFSLIPTVSKGEKAELHILNPDFWNFFHRYDVNEIEFINCQHLEERPKDNTLKAYENIINQDYSSLFLNTKYTTYMEVYISCVREIDGGVMKIRFYDRDNSRNELKFKETVQVQTVSLIKHELSLKEKLAKDMDSKYKYNLSHQ